jgi:N-acetylmuramoyl-L-alanine amidase
MRQIKYIVLHCTAGPQNQSLEVIKAFWRSKGWKKYGYHHMIKPDGTIINLVPIEEISNGVQGFNAHSINISYFGGVGTHGEILDNRTEQQKAAQKELVTKYMAMFPTATVLGHRDFSPDKNRDGIIEESEWMKACPSFSVKEWLQQENIIRNPIMPTVKKLIITMSGSGVNVRKGPSTAAEILYKLEDGNDCIVNGTSGEWSMIQVNDKIEGWVKSEFLK